MILRPFLYEETACASYLFGCLSQIQARRRRPARRARRDLPGGGRARGGADRGRLRDTRAGRSRLRAAALVEATGATAYLPDGAGVEFQHVGLADGDVVQLGNTIVHALATPGHAPAHHAYVVADRRRGTEEPWLVFTGDSLLVGDVGRPDLHAKGEPEALARELFHSIERLLELPDHVLAYPSHFGGSVCGRALSANPFSSIGFERRHNQALSQADDGSFARALLVDVPPPPADQAAIVAANRGGLSPTRQ